MVIVKPDMTDEEIIARINNEIDKRRNYGVRAESVPKNRNAFVLSWSNNAAQWLIFYPNLGSNRSAGWRRLYPDIKDTKDLDANQILVVGVGPNRLRRIVEELDELPLYAGSFEAGERGNFSLRSIEIPSGIKKALVESELEMSEMPPSIRKDLRDSGLVQGLDAQTLRALKEKAEEN